MTRDEIKAEIIKELEGFSEQALRDILALLRDIKGKSSADFSDDKVLPV